VIDQHCENHAGAYQEENAKSVLISVVRLTHDLMLAHVPDDAARRAYENQFHARVVPESGQKGQSRRPPEQLGNLELVV